MAKFVAAAVVIGALRVKLFGLEQDWPCLKNIYYFINFPSLTGDWSFVQKYFDCNLSDSSLFCLKQIDPTQMLAVAILCPSLHTLVLVCLLWQEPSYAITCQHNNCLSL